MVNGIGGGGGMAREAIAAAMRAQQQAAQNISGGAGAQPGQGLGATGMPGASGPVGGVGQVEGTSFAQKLSDGLSQVTDQVSAAEKLPEEMLNGEVSDFHDVAIQLKQSDLSFRFALQVRNKLIDAYREVMRMSV